MGPYSFSKLGAAANVSRPRIRTALTRRMSNLVIDLDVVHVEVQIFNESFPSWLRHDVATDKTF